VTVGASILERIIEPQRGGFSNEHARYILQSKAGISLKKAIRSTPIDEGLFPV
jgi:hypothetical protein